MRIVTFASGSTGNCSLISDGEVNILIDAGISARRICENLALAGLAPQDIGGVLITHEHSDHISGLSVFAKKYGVKVYAPEKLCGILKRNPKLKEDIEYIGIADSIGIGSLSITPFLTPHDSEFSCGYRIEGSAIIAYATDTGHISDSMEKALSGADIAVIEANHDVDMLKNGPYPYVLKQRVLSPRGHLSNDDCAILAQKLSECGTRHIILGHLSRENNTPSVAFETVSAAVSNKNTEIYVAPANKALEVSVEDRVQC